MRKLIILFLSVLWTAGGFAQTSEKADSSSNVLDDVVVQAQFKGVFEEDKLPLATNFDYSNETVIENRVNWNSLAEVENETASAEKEVILPLHFSQPQFAQIQPAPVKAFRLKFENLQRWQLNITSGDGSQFRQIAGEGNPPESISWDGLSTNKDPLLAGRNYAYSFTAVDKAGNKRTFPGNSFQVPAFFLELGDSLLIGLGQKTLFSDDGLRLLPGSIDYAREVATLIRYKMNGPQKVQVAFQTATGEKFLQMVADELVVEKSFFARINPQENSKNGLVFYIVPN
ncbi:MAG: hypothetical protein DWQ05_16495 [Calditrichaeota bacterium]|nr:MAG: hypothetical protein DWQ05_16495 [Calditrichota bacterium]